MIATCQAREGNGKYVSFVPHFSRDFLTALEMSMLSEVGHGVGFLFLFCFCSLFAFLFSISSLIALLFYSSSSLVLCLPFCLPSLHTHRIGDLNLPILLHCICSGVVFQLDSLITRMHLQTCDNHGADGPSVFA